MQNLKQVERSNRPNTYWPSVARPVYEASCREGECGAPLVGTVSSQTQHTPQSDAFQVPGRQHAWPDEAARMLDDVRSAMMYGPAAARAAVSRLQALLAVSTEHDTADVRGNLVPWQKQRIDRYMRARLGQQLSVTELAAQVSLSVSHFCRAFKGSFGVPPHAHLIRLRIERAQRLMLGTQEPLSQIALACGLADQAHLSKLFRRAMHESPSTWRRRNLTEPLGQKRDRRSAAPVKRE